MNELTEFISGVGFPIFCCCVLLYQQYNANNFNNQYLQSMHETIENNTQAINDLIQLLNNKVGE